MNLFSNNIFNPLDFAMLVPMIAQCTQVQNTCDSTPLIRTRGGVRQ